MPRARNGKTEVKRTRGTRGKVAAKSTGAKTGNARKYVRLSVTENVRVGQQIVLLRNSPKPMSWPAIEKKLGVPVRTAKRMYARAAEVNAMHSEAAAERVIDHSLAVIEEMIEEVARIAVESESESVKLGALRTVASTTVTKLELMAGLGRLPVNTAAKRGTDAVMFLLERLAEALDQFELPGEFRDLVEDLHQQALPVIEGRVLMQESQA